MQQPDDTQRSRELLARALRHAEVYREQARDWESRAREHERLARRTRDLMFIGAVLVIISWVAFFLSLGGFR